MIYTVYEDPEKGVWGVIDELGGILYDADDMDIAQAQALANAHNAGASSFDEAIDWLEGQGIVWGRMAIVGANPTEWASIVAGLHDELRAQAARIAELERDRENAAEMLNSVELQRHFLEAQLATALATIEYASQRNEQLRGQLSAMLNAAIASSAKSAATGADYAEGCAP